MKCPVCSASFPLPRDDNPPKEAALSGIDASAVVASEDGLLVAGGALHETLMEQLVR